ncbi:hypothetical protein C493_22226 [Natronolimnohabitans innermongolicus JCM 12255]|uniref:Uncharacterized protein n=1 Tax=Natronolimnohabitans innermongolicus JCM 12255 TaxID=1227499 RepID=L9WE38_9EURY|nr:hypothetical protein C493_22226 [Natronolimnohabitans innermongolicus JCM 12255]
MLSVRFLRRVPQSVDESRSRDRNLSTVVILVVTQNELEFIVGADSNLDLERRRVPIGMHVPVAGRDFVADRRDLRVRYSEHSGRARARGARDARAKGRE